MGDLILGLILLATDILLRNTLNPAASLWKVSFKFTVKFRPEALKSKVCYWKI